MRRILQRRLIRRDRTDAAATRVLLFPHGGLGDRVVFEALVRHAAEAAPADRVVAAIPFHAAQYDARRYAPGPDEVWIVESWPSDGLPELAGRVHRLAEATFGWAGPVATTCFGPPSDRPRTGFGLSWAEPYAALAALGRAGIHPRFEVGEREAAAAAAWRAGFSNGDADVFVALHCRARPNAPAKNLDVDDAVALARALQAAPGWSVVAVGSDDLPAPVAGVARAVLGGDDPELSATAASLAACDAFVGGESGPLHLAAAVGRPVVHLAAPGRGGGRWGPFAPPDRVAEVSATPRSASGPLGFDPGAAAAAVRALVSAARARDRLGG